MLPVSAVYTLGAVDASGNFSLWKKYAGSLYFGGMSMDAVGAYIATLRDGRGFTQQAFAELMGISERGLRDWEKGRTAPDVDALSSLLARLKGSWMHVALLAREEATAEQGRNLARRRLKDVGLTDDQRAFIESLDDDQLKALIAVAEQMKRR